MEGAACGACLERAAGTTALRRPEMKSKWTDPNAMDVKERIQQLQIEAVEQLEQKLDQLVSEALQATQVTNRVPSLDDQLLFNDAKYHNRKQSTDSKSLPEKQFVARNSPLTDLLRIKHFRTIYNIFEALLLILLLQTGIYDLIVYGELKMGFSTIYWNFRGIHTVLATWLCMKASVFGLFVAFNIWTSLRISLIKPDWRRKLLDHGALTALVLYEVAFLTVPPSTIRHNQLPPVSAMIILCEQVRMIMKTYAFLRSCIPKVKTYKPHSECSDKPVPSFNHFLCFLFAPTLVYRDSYPRTKEIRWNIVMWSLLEISGSILFLALVFERSLVPTHMNFGKQPPTVMEAVVDIFSSVIPALGVAFCGFYCVLHAWFNMFAEMTQFADRMFYKDWWNDESFQAFYRNWNVVVHDWLYTYVYKDICKLQGMRRHYLPTVAVFLVSAFFHEYILTFMFGFCYPFLFFSFAGYSAVMQIMTKDKFPGGNVVMWMQLAFGVGCVSSVYMMEWFARRNCPQISDSPWEFFIPRSLFCFPSKTNATEFVDRMSDINGDAYL